MYAENIIASLVLDLIVHYTEYGWNEFIRLVICTESGWDEVLRLVEVIRLFFIVAYMLL